LSAQSAVLQVVILRDGLLVGTEVLVPGSYVLGSGDGSDVRLDDPSVAKQHATLYFQNGRAAIQDSGSPVGVYVNGHRVKACEVRSQDEVTCGPFVIKVRVVSKAPTEKAAPPPEVAALLKGGTPAPAKPAARHTPNPGPTVAAKQSPLGLAATVAGPTAARSPREGPATVYSARKRAEMVPPAVAPLGAPHPVNGHAQRAPQYDAEQPTQHVMVPAELLDLTNPRGPRRDDPKTHRVDVSDVDPFDFGQGVETSETAPSRETHSTSHTKPVSQVPSIRAGKGPPRLYFEVWWGETRQAAKSFGLDPKKPVIAEPEVKRNNLPLWGFTLPESGFVIAETRGKGFRVFAPPGAAVESKKGDSFYPLSARELEGQGSHRYVALSMGNAVRFSSGEMSLVAYVAPPPERIFVNPFFGMPWLLVFTMTLALGGFGTFLYYAPKQSELPDFTAKNLPAVAVRLIAPEPKKKEEAKKALEKIKDAAKQPEKAKKEQKAQVAKPEKVPPKQAPPPSVEKVTKLLSKLTSAGPGSKDILAAVDKLGNGPGSKFSKNSDYKLSGLIGKAPIANAGLGTFGLGGGGRGGFATQGAELLHGRGAGGIGALGVGGVGRGAVGGIVTRASARNVAVQGSIDREAVAKVVNQHLQEVRGCYERALLKDPSLSGKVVLEWSISIAGKVVSAKTKSSTLRNGEVEGCILNYLKQWQFPLAHGGVVIISYPFLFNSVGY
jgi:hypothetical protein